MGREFVAKRPPRTAPVRLAVWALHMALPLLGLWLLLEHPDLDVRWEHHASHFWLVGVVAAINVALGAMVLRASAEHEDARLYLVGLGFVASAAFLGLHALATPGVILSGPNGGFNAATAVGLFCAAVLFFASSMELSVDRAQAVMRLRTPLAVVVGVLLGSWTVLSLAELPPLREPIEREVAGPLGVLAVAGVVLFTVTAVNYFRVHRRRPSVLLASLTTASVLLAESLVAVAFARNWHASWWEWHLLMAFGFGFVAYSAHVKYRLEGDMTGLFNALSLEETLADVRKIYGAALEQLTDAVDARASGERTEPVGPLARHLGERFGLTEAQTDVLDRAAEALAAERDQLRRLESLVAIGKESSVVVDEETLLHRTVDHLAPSVGRDEVRIGVVREGELVFPDGLAHPEPFEVDETDDGTLVLPLEVKGRRAGVVAVRRPGTFEERDLAVWRSVATQLGIALENARLYEQLDSLFRSYLSPDVATALLADPEQAALGGAVVDVTMVFADLPGFTPMSERLSPPQVVELLNRYYGAAAPAILDEGGTLVQYQGDALVAMFGAPVRHPDHAERAARAVLAMHRAVSKVAPEDGSPRFRVGVNSGPAVVGNIGAEEIRSYTAIGDTVNVAARLEGVGEPGQVVISGATRDRLGDAAEVRPLGEVHVKGKADPVEAFVLDGIRE